MSVNDKYSDKYRELKAFIVEYDSPIVDIYCLAEDENMAALMGKHAYPVGKPFTINTLTNVLSNDNMLDKLWSHAVRGYVMVHGHTLRMNATKCPFVPYQTREEKIDLLLLTQP